MAEMADNSLLLTNSPPKNRSIGLKDFNQLISCHLCKGYLIDATTVIECLHSFCKTCIINHLESNTPKSRFCPYCDNQIHKTKPKLNIRSDPTLQDIVYKLVPGLYKNEMNRRKEFYSKEPESAMGLSNEEKGEMSGERLIFTPEDSIYLAIEYFPQVISYALLPFNKNLTNGSLNVEPNPSVNGQTDGKNDSQRRYLKCEGGMRVLHLKKWLKLKYDVRDHNDIEILYKHDPLLDDYTMIDLAYIYSWRRNGPLCLYYKIVEPQKMTKDEGRPFKAPTAVAKRRHTLKHRHKQNNKRAKLIDESNLITTNPVNEPLPPVDSALIDRVMATNSIGANIDIMTSVVNSALNKTANNGNKPKKSTKNGLKSNDCIKQMKKKLDKTIKNNKKSVPKSTVNNSNSKSVDLSAGALNASAGNISADQKTADKIDSNMIKMKTNGFKEKSFKDNNSITNNIQKTFNSLSKQLKSVFTPKTNGTSIDSNIKPVKSSVPPLISAQNKPIPPITDQKSAVQPTITTQKRPVPPQPIDAQKSSVQPPITDMKCPVPPSIPAQKSPLPQPLTVQKNAVPTAKIVQKSAAPPQKTVQKSGVPPPIAVPKSSLAAPITAQKSPAPPMTVQKSPAPPPITVQKSPVPLPVPAYMSPKIPLPAPDVFQLMHLIQNTSKLLPNITKNDSNSDNEDIEVALNLSTSSKHKTT